MSVLVIAEHDQNNLKVQTQVAVAAAKAIGGDIHILVAGQNCQGAADAAAKVDGVQKVLLADHENFGHALAEELSNLIVSVAEGYSHILTVATTSGKNYMPRVAALLDVSQISEIVSVESEDTFKRPIYAGNAIATVQSSDAVKVLTVRGTAYDPVSAEGGSATIEAVDAPAAMGVSSWVREDVVALEDLYIAVGISGAIQHLAGMKDSKVIVAINKDEDAPIFQVADYGLVADLFKAVPELDSML